ncbi:MAG TPA: cellulose biosynthesis cyclic di-GMP-binding regulatory protein BcsB, partial [Methylomirabilota bacterium]|nr:cellulose biosynthesis cyclic di-GMP-binding regulatory protein BcsB [Methylomirabilota bacterium]
IILVGESTAALDRLAASIAGSGDRTVSGTRDGLAVLSAAFGRPMAEEEPVPLAAFGVPTIDFAGRRMAEQVAVTLPADFFASGYGSVRLTLHGKYIAGLTHDSALRIRVNDVVAATVQLVSSGEAWSGRDIELPLQMFHPGPNAVQLEAVTQTEADLVCDPTVSSADASRIRLDARTSITFPRLARVGNLPEIGATMAAGYPYTATADPVPFWTTGRDAATVGAAATVATQLAVAQGRPMPVNLTFRAPVGTDAGGIVVATTNALPDWLRSPMADDPAFATDRESQASNPKFNLADAPGPGPLEPVQIAPLAVYNDTLAASDLPTAEDQDGGLFSHVEEFRRFAGSADWNAVVHDALVDARRKVADLATGTVRREIVLPGPSDLVVYQTADLPTGTSVSDAIFKTGSVPRAWTVFTAETTGALAAGVAGVAGEQRWNQISGRLTVVRHGESRIDAIPADKQVLTATRSFTFGNARLALAGWFSRNTILYVEAMLAVCVLLGAVGFVYSRVAGNRSS